MARVSLEGWASKASFEEGQFCGTDRSVAVYFKIQGLVANHGLS